MLDVVLAFEIVIRLVAMLLVWLGSDTWNATERVPRMALAAL